MKSLQHFSAYLLCFAIATGGLLSGCKRDAPEPHKDELRNITFRLSGFEAETTPMGRSHAKARLAAHPSAPGMQALGNVEPGPEAQYLYYWSFNDETLEPDIAVDDVGAGIEFEAAANEPSFPAGFGGDGFAAGQSMSLRGGEMIVISMPMEKIESLQRFAFDISSSNTGPKDFSLSYSIDGGDTYVVVGASNQFENMGEQSRNQYEFDVNAYGYLAAETFKIKLIFLSGERPLRPVENEGDDPLPFEYNASQGTVRLDNIRLSGVYNAEMEAVDPSVPSTLHYYVFSADDGSVVQQQVLGMDALEEDGSLDVKLAEGHYDVLFLAYRSDRGILLPPDLANASEFYFGQHFDDHRAVTYAVLLEDIAVGESDIEAAATLTRCYSLVEFDFTDLAVDLAAVREIVITKDHANYLYTPFGIPSAGPVSDAQSITFSGFDNTEDYRIALHQFLGAPAGVRTVNYELTAYGEGNVMLNAVTIAHDIRNNVRLRLTGRLLGNSGTISGFAVALNTEWGETLEHGF